MYNQYVVEVNEKIAKAEKVARIKGIPLGIVYTITYEINGYETITESITLDSIYKLKDTEMKKIIKDDRQGAKAAVIKECYSNRTRYV